VSGGVGTYRQRCDEIASAGYEGFTLGTVDGQGGDDIESGAVRVGNRDER
jgi:hypothetical protein